LAIDLEKQKAAMFIIGTATPGAYPVVIVGPVKFTDVTPADINSLKRTRLQVDDDTTTFFGPLALAMKSTIMRGIARATPPKRKSI